MSAVEDRVHFLGKAEWLPDDHPGKVHHLVDLRSFLRQGAYRLDDDRALGRPPAGSHSPNPRVDIPWHNDLLAYQHSLAIVHNPSV